MTIAAKHGVDVLPAAPSDHEALPPQFLEKRLEPCREKVAAAIAAVRWPFVAELLLPREDLAIGGRQRLGHGGPVAPREA